MKKLIYVLLVLFVLFVSVTVNAQEDTTEPTPAPEEDTEETGIKDKINDLKERLATRVAELRAQNKRSFYGVIKEKDETSLVLLYEDEEIPIAVDDETAYYSLDSAGKQSDATIDSFELGETATVFGQLDLDNKTVIATYLYEQQLALIDHGAVTEVDEDDGSFTIESSSGSITLDYEISTRCTLIEEGEKTRCGLSSISPGDHVFVRIDPDEEDLARATARRILLVLQPEVPTPTSASPTAPVEQ
ncbi:hypothetical protein HY469_02720 [Candidatus Roizmanbacteria bacterium]|nr:hypothetical protein [Candidatus Roizmanbacteria bacterium]